MTFINTAKDYLQKIRKLGKRFTLGSVAKLCLRRLTLSAKRIVSVVRCIYIYISIYNRKRSAFPGVSVLFSDCRKPHYNIRGNGYELIR